MLEQIKKISQALSKAFASDQNSYIRQMADGNYARNSGWLSPEVVRESIRAGAAIGPYQKNIDSSVNWLCFDFDVKKEFLGGDFFALAMDELNSSVDLFCEKLRGVDIPYLLEFSGQRGMHVWILFSERISYKNAYEMTSLIRSTYISVPDTGMIAVDLFPKTRTPSGGVGLGVKIPLSKHVKTNFYSLFTEDQSRASSAVRVNVLTEQIVVQQSCILDGKKEISKADAEKKLGIFFDLSQDSSMTVARVKSISLTTEKFTVGDIVSHWNSQKPLAKIVNRFLNEKSLNHAERMLLVGIFINVKSEKFNDFGESILLKTLSKTSNYDEVKSKKALKKLQSFHFPSQLQIENVTGEKFEKLLSTDELLELCIPKYRNYVDGSFELSLDDIEVTRAAEINYLFQNDEVQSAKLIGFLSASDGVELLSLVNDFIDLNPQPNYYLHVRNEPAKQRELVTLGGVERLATSAIMKQLLYFFEFQSSENSFGYQVNQGFKDRYIFKPWLNLWVEFVAGISSVVEDVENEECYIVKADISRYYDEIPHEPIKRLLLGGVNEKINKKVNVLSVESKASYQKAIQTLFHVTSSLSKGGSGRGLPQGPAYARFLAELYLDNIDSNFDLALRSGEVLFYRRYVDDIFIVCRSELEAKEQLAILKKQVQNLGLCINDEKTKITRIGNFSEDFQRYRAQSKYTVDRASRNYEQATDTQKNLAINEFISIIQADTCEDDLAFVFSHLTGVSEVDHLKAEKVIPTLKSGFGRGSLFRHLFNFVVESSDRWTLLSAIDQFNPLQSEVLTSVVLSYIGSVKHERDNFDAMIISVLPKLNKTRLVQENVCLLKMMYGIELDLGDVEVDVLLEILSGCSDPLELYVDDALVERLVLALNAEQSLPDFVSYLYPLSMCPNVSSVSLNKLAQIFYAKISNASRLNLLSLTQYPAIIYELPATRFYHLLCLFSLSDVNEDLDVLKAAWNYCIEIFNYIEVFNRTLRPDNWFKRLSDLSISHPKSNVVITAIIDGSICRGVADSNNLFEMFHGAVIIFLAGDSAIKALVDIASALEALKGKGRFYKWIIENEGVHFFPNRNWFEKNAFENNCIILRKDNEILIRKKETDFVSVSGISVYQTGYGEKIEKYHMSYGSLRQLLIGKTVVEKLGVFLYLIEMFEGGSYPNVFSDERMLNPISMIPFTKELGNLPRLLREDSNGEVASYPNEQKNFIACLFGLSFSDGTGGVFELLREKYLPVLSGFINVHKFLSFMKCELAKITDVDNKLFLDLAVASSLYQALEKDESLIDRFVEAYEKINKINGDKSIYCVSVEDVVDDSTPALMFGVVSNALGRAVQCVVPTLSFFLDVNVKDYFFRLCSIVRADNSLGIEIDLTQFIKVRVEVRYTERLVSCAHWESLFENTAVFNLVAGELQMFSSSQHSYVLRSSEHIFAIFKNNFLILLPIIPSISKMYSSIKTRRVELAKNNVAKTSYPVFQFDDVSINLSHFTKAVDNISIHRDITMSQADTIFRRWLSGLPKRFHQGLCTLIAGHVVMRPEEVEKFISTVRDLLSAKSNNPFFIKKVGDFNGAHRILFKDLNLGRVLDKFEPLSIQEGCSEVTLIVDNVISGSQIIKALKFYLGGGERDENYYPYSTEQLAVLGDRLKQVKVLNICQVFHTSEGIDLIALECKALLNPDVEVKALGGRDLGRNALFGTSDKIGERDKKLLRELFQVKESLQELFRGLEGRLELREFYNLDKLNLVARYRSLPKKCFAFLALGLLHDKSCSPFERVLEVSGGK